MLSPAAAKWAEKRRRILPCSKTVIEMRDQILQELDGVSKLHVIKILYEFNVKQYLNTKITEITDSHVIVENQHGLAAIEALALVIFPSTNWRSTLIKAAKIGW
ncbi:hypothetical protein [Brenneria tiliae]|uniref:Uncharacterized protein n=1 Tax=Brenneria tiliae TaxID=2914984 RepID=A0ABT0MQ46_9GAMM|nr:hypothetical protein [Brenneria tiliae]MCL2891955.1 hypothetical protein [Brenneria tiliae]